MHWARHDGHPSLTGGRRNDVLGAAQGLVLSRLGPPSWADRSVVSAGANVAGSGLELEAAAAAQQAQQLPAAAASGMAATAAALLGGGGGGSREEAEGGAS